MSSLASLSAFGSETYYPNESYLRTKNNQEVIGSAEQRRKEFEDSLLDPHSMAEMRLEYQDIRRDPWLRRASGFSTQSAESADYEALRLFSSRFLDRILKNQVKTRVDSFTRNKGPGTSSTPSSLEKTVTSVQKTVSNQAFEVGTKTASGFELKTGGELQLPSSRAKIWAQSSIVNGALDYEYAAPWPINPFTLQFGPVDRRRDPIEITVWRTIPLVNVQGNLVYGTNSTILSTGLSTELLPDLSARISALTGMDPVRSGLGTSVQKEIRVDYNIRF